MANIHSFESFGTVDGPGVRFVLFLQGCPMRCLYCHNPDTWLQKGGKQMDVEEVFTQIMKYKNYIKDGGVTISGGEPLLQIDFVIELFKKLKKEHIHTCVDTSGITFTQDPATIKKFEELLNVTDLFLLDMKHIDAKKHEILTSHSNIRIKEFARFLEAHQKPMWIRYVLVPGYSDDMEDIQALDAYLDTFINIEKVEVLPYHKMGTVKYEALKLPYPLAGVDEPSEELTQKVKDILERRRSHA